MVTETSYKDEAGKVDVVDAGLPQEVRSRSSGSREDVRRPHAGFRVAAQLSDDGGWWRGRVAPGVERRARARRRARGDVVR